MQPNRKTSFYGIAMALLVAGTIADALQETVEDASNNRVKRSLAVGRFNLRPGKRSIATGRFNLRPGKRSLAVGRFNLRPGKRSNSIYTVDDGICSMDALESAVDKVEDIIAELELYSAYLKRCEMDQ